MYDSLLQEKLTNDQEAHVSAEDSLRKKLKQTEKQMENKIRVYDDEMSKYAEKLSLLKELYKEESERFAVLKARLAAIQQDRTLYEESVEKPERLQLLGTSNDVLRMHSARVIQRAYRSFRKRAAVTNVRRADAGSGSKVATSLVKDDIAASSKVATLVKDDVVAASAKSRRKSGRISPTNSKSPATSLTAAARADSTEVDADTHEEDV